MEPVNKRLILATVLLVAVTSFAGTWITSPGKGSHAAAGGGFTANSATWDGASALRFTGSAITMSEAGKQFTASLWVYLDDATLHRFLICGRGGGAGQQWRVTINSGDVFVLLQNSAAANIVFVDGNTTIAAAGWYHILFSCDTSSTSLRHLYINGASSVGTWTAYTVDGIPSLSRTELTLGADDSSSNRLDGCMAEIWVDDTYIDFSVQANREKFASPTGTPVSLGTDGSTPTGSAPDLYMKFVSGSLGVNSGADGGTAGVVGTAITNGTCGTVDY